MDADRIIGWLGKIMVFSTPSALNLTSVGCSGHLGLCGFARCHAAGNDQSALSGTNRFWYTLCNENKMLVAGIRW